MTYDEACALVRRLNAMLPPGLHVEIEPHYLDLGVTREYVTLTVGQWELWLYATGDDRLAITPHDLRSLIQDLEAVQP